MKHRHILTEEAYVAALLGHKHPLPIEGGRLRLARAFFEAAENPAVSGVASYVGMLEGDVLGDEPAPPAWQGIAGVVIAEVEDIVARELAARAKKGAPTK